MNKKKIHQFVHKALVKADLIALIKAGAPKDEYDSEAEMITGYIHQHRRLGKKIGHVESLGQLERSIADTTYGVFVIMFGRDLAERIHKKEIASLAKVVAGLITKKSKR